MNPQTPYNPLDKLNLARSVTEALLATPPQPLPPTRFVGAGIYALYYVGDFAPYSPIALRNTNNQFEAPIYVGKAIPEGSRKGGFGFDSSRGTFLFKRLRQHAKSISLATNLELGDFYCRYLVVDDIWIPLGEALLIHRFQPIWNRIIEGFGNNDPGGKRYTGEKPIWDVLHPGRPWAERMSPNSRSEEDILDLLSTFLATHPPDLSISQAVSQQLAVSLFQDEDETD